MHRSLGQILDAAQAAAGLSPRVARKTLWFNGKFDLSYVSWQYHHCCLTTEYFVLHLSKEKTV